jgi:hypothetical protein
MGYNDIKRVKASADNFLLDLVCVPKVLASQFIKRS